MLATKANLLKTKDDLAFAKEGYELLEQKREILVLEIMRFVERVKIIEKRMSVEFKKAFEAYKKALTTEGRDKIIMIAEGCNYEHRLIIKNHKIASVSLPVLDISLAPPDLKYSTFLTSSSVDASMDRFVRTLDIVCEMAETINSVIRLSKELKKTQRRVNALDKILIPQYTEEIKYIEERLESDIRDEFYIKKMIKNKKEKKSFNKKGMKK